jgi:dihydrofolate synthase/folylpolyglutamate synthase
VHSSGLEGSVVDIAGKEIELANLALSLPGTYQFANLAVALSVIQVLRAAGEFDITAQAEREGLSNVQKLTGLAGRLTVLQERPRIIADVAHNPEAARELANSVRSLKFGRLVTVFGVLKDKDYLPMIHEIAGISEEVVAVAPRSDRARSASDVAAGFQKEGCRVRAALSVEEGLALALEVAADRGTILITGSHYVVGEAMNSLSRKRA